MNPQPSAPLVLGWLLFATGTLIVKSLPKSNALSNCKAPVLPVFGSVFWLKAVNVPLLGNSRG